MPKFFDTHTHANFNVFKNDSQEVIERALKNGVWLVNVGSQASTSKRAVEIAQNYQEGVYAAVGLHPSHLEDEDFDEKFYLELAKNEKTVAIGECGLDYYRVNSEKGIVNSEKEKQKEVFIKHIELANKIKKPLIIHCRAQRDFNPAQRDVADAHDDLLEILNSKFQILNSPAGIMHFFTGDYEQAKQYIDLGFYISFSGVITFPPRADQLLAGANYEELVKKLPLEKILIETDAPYAAPIPYRGQRNEPSYVIEVAKKIAEIKNISLNKVEQQTTENAKVVFGLKI